MKVNLPSIVLLMGPTGIGKTSFAINMSKEYPVEAISVDTGMIYKDMNIGTNKPTKQEQLKLKHNMIDIILPNKSYSVGDFLLDINTNIIRTMSSGKIPLLVGGSMLYFNMIKNGLLSLPYKNFHIRKKVKYILSGKKKHLVNNSSKHCYPVELNKNKIDRQMETYLLTQSAFMHTCGYRIQQFRRKDLINRFNLIPLTIKMSSRFFLNKNIRFRFMQMLEKGFVKEVELLLQKYNVKKSSESMKLIGYREIYRYILSNRNDMNYKNMIDNAVISTRKLVKKQTTFLKTWNNLIELDLEKRKKNDILHEVGKYLKK